MVNFHTKEYVKHSSVFFISFLMHTSGFLFARIFIKHFRLCNWSIQWCSYRWLSFMLINVCYYVLSTWKCLGCLLSCSSLKFDLAFLIKFDMPQRSQKFCFVITEEKQWKHVVENAVAHIFSCFLNINCLHFFANFCRGSTILFKKWLTIQHKFIHMYFHCVQVIYMHSLLHMSCLVVPR